MIVASHQPNFMPHMGFFYKMYMCDVFTLSDSVGYSRQAFHNYNYISSDGERSKVTVPVSSRTGAINTVKLCEWEYNRRKIWQRLCTEYRHAPYFNEYKGIFEPLFASEYTFLYELNTALIRAFYDLFGFNCKLIFESDLNLTGFSATEQIADICKKTGCNVYLSGSGAKAYLDEDYLRSCDVTVRWSEYQPHGLSEGLSVFDYVMKYGAAIPDDWKKHKEGLIYG